MKNDSEPEERQVTRMAIPVEMVIFVKTAPLSRTPKTKTESVKAWGMRGAAVEWPGLRRGVTRTFTTSGGMRGAAVDRP